MARQKQFRRKKKYPVSKQKISPAKGRMSAVLRKSSLSRRK